MGMREKLIELLHSGDRCSGVVGDGYGCCDCPHHSLEKPCDEFAATADMLIANDVVPVVRCKDCKHWTMGYCNNFAYYDYEPVTNESDFCSYGERREGE